MKLEKDSIKTALILMVMGVVFSNIVGQVSILGRMVGDVIVIAGFGVFILWIIKIVKKPKGN